MYTSMHMSMHRLERASVSITDALLEDEVGQRRMFISVREVCPGMCLAIFLAMFLAMCLDILDMCLDVCLDMC